MAKTNSKKLLYLRGHERFVFTAGCFNCFIWGLFLVLWADKFLNQHGFHSFSHYCSRNTPYYNPYNPFNLEVLIGFGLFFGFVCLLEAGSLLVLSAQRPPQPLNIGELIELGLNWLLRVFLKNTHGFILLFATLALPEYRPHYLVLSLIALVLIALMQIGYWKDYQMQTFK